MQAEGVVTTSGAEAEQLWKDPTPGLRARPRWGGCGGRPLGGGEVRVLLPGLEGRTLCAEGKKGTSETPWEATYYDASETHWVSTTA